MSNEQHTPGPWRCSAGFVQSSKWLVCRMIGNNADCKLIASAPDLLAACKAALAAISQPMTYPADIAAAKKWLTDAVAKAEGRA